MVLKKLLLNSLIVVGLVGCRDTETIDHVADFVDRCWEYVDTGDFPSRSLFWNSNDGMPRYENGDATVSVTISGLNLDHLSCTVVSRLDGLQDSEITAIFEYVTSNARSWITMREVSLAADMVVFDVSNDTQLRHAIFQASEYGGAFVEVSQDRRSDETQIRLGKSLFDVTAKVR